MDFNPAMMRGMWLPVLSLNGAGAGVVDVFAPRFLLWAANVNNATPLLLIS